MTGGSNSSQWWCLAVSSLAIGVLLLPFVRAVWGLEMAVWSTSEYATIGATALASAGLSSSLYLDARRIESDDWRPNPQLYAVGGALYPLSLVVGAWYLSERQWHVGLVGTNAVDPSSDVPLVASRWHYWIALGPLCCLVGVVVASVFGLSGLLIGMLCWVVGIGSFVVAINVDVRRVRAAELEWRPGVGRYTYPPLLALFSLAFAPVIMLVVGGVYLFQRRRYVGRAL